MRDNRDKGTSLISNARFVCVFVIHLRTTLHMTNSNANKQKERFFIACTFLLFHKLKLKNFVAASELYRPIDRRLLAKLVPSFAGRGCHVVSATDR
jgi:hypothetical protein